jgi:histidyl-tRNA synthetase
MTRNQFQSPKGTKDTLPEEQPYWHYVEETIRRVARLYHYERLDLPVFEETALFQRGVGEGTDIVDKEMYTFKDKGGTLITLRPEFTAGVMRAYLQHGMSSLSNPVKVWSTGPVFRYERPQAGRFRQHTQFNVEALGEQDPALDFEVMSVAWTLYSDLGFENLSFQINSIGCPRCRPDYLKKLVQHYRNHKKDICDECTNRLNKNPLRILDCKNEGCQSIIEKAPAVADVLCEECDSHFRSLRSYLDAMNRPYHLNHRLVRGLDYYTKTVFEVWAQGIGAQNAVCGGGRYDGLAEALGGPPTPAVGFASGLERIVLTLKQHGVHVPGIAAPSVFFAYRGEKAKSHVIEFLSRIREAGIQGIMGFGDRSLKAQLREAHRREATYTMILGEEEIEKKEIQVKTMDGGTQILIPWENLISFLKERR